MGNRELSSRNFVQESSGGGHKAQSDMLRLLVYGMRMEIGRWMPIGGIRFTEPSRMIQPTKWKISSLNEILVEWGVSFVFVENQFEA